MPDPDGKQNRGCECRLAVAATCLRRTSARRSTGSVFHRIEEGFRTPEDLETTDSTSCRESSDSHAWRQRLLPHPAHRLRNRTNQSSAWSAIGSAAVDPPRSSHPCRVRSGVPLRRSDRTCLQGLVTLTREQGKPGKMLSTAAKQKLCRCNPVELVVQVKRHCIPYFRSRRVIASGNEPWQASGR